MHRYKLWILCLITSALFGCNNANNHPRYSDTSGSQMYHESDEFNNADSDVQEDVVIYNILRNMGYSDAESKRAVINSMD